MEILFATAEIAPYSHGCEVGEVCRALSRTLVEIQHSVTVVSPLYAGVSPADRSLARRLSPLQVEVAGRRFAFELYDGKSPSGVKLLFVANEELFERCPSVSGDGGHDDDDTDGSAQDALRAAAFSRAVVQLVQVQEPGVEILHVHDWLSALALPWTGRDIPGLPRALSLHSLRRQGRFARETATALGLDTIPELVEASGQANLLRAAVAQADLLVAPSETLAWEIAREGQADEIGELLRSRVDKLAGVSNGVDTGAWNPGTDQELPAQFSAENTAGKQRCKAAMQFELGLPVRPRIPLLAAVGGLGPDRKDDILLEAAERFLENDVQLVVVTETTGEVAEALQALQDRFADRMKVRTSSNSALSRRTIAASDFVLMPYEAQAHSVLHLRAQRYGTLPVVRRVGSLADAVVDCDSSLRTGTGFAFEEDSWRDLLAAVQRGIGAYAQREAFETLRQKVMNLDHSWQRAGRRYEYLYGKLLAA